MTLNEKIAWMKNWAEPQGLEVVTEGECGFGRKCVGLSAVAGECYPDYKWYDENWNYADKNGEVWTPDDAYHKHECVAVLGRGENAINQLYDWCVWFNENDFELTVTKNDKAKKDYLLFFPGIVNNYRMEKTD